MDMAEKQILRGRAGQIMNAECVRIVERKVEELEPLVVMVRNISRTCAVSEKLDQFEEEREIRGNELHHIRPSLSAFFSGRKRELATLQNILESEGSAVITQYGGAGKTELMIAFADHAERDKMVPGGVFWVMVDGGERDVIESLAGLAEKLIQRKMDDEERRNGNLVVAALKQGLDEREGRWLLCLDGADDSKVSGILNEVCRITEAGRGKGWIMVTSRQGQPHIWSEMTSEQKLVLEPLCAEDAMVALWRQIRKTRMDVADDDAVMKAIKDLEKDQTEEFRALKELCGDEGACSLGGLPLALVQAGTYIARFHCSFAEYLYMFENANRLEDMKHLMKNTEEVKPIRESQRSIWTTWKISVRQLSEKAYAVLRTMAMLGPCGIAEAMVKRILKEIAADERGSVDWMFRSVVIGELVHGSSLIYRDNSGTGRQEGSVYRMHRLVRRFILSSMERGSALWNELYSTALLSTHEVAATELEKEAKSFGELPEIFGLNHRETVAHASALVCHYTLPEQGADIQHASKVEDMHRYCGMAMKFIGKADNEVRVWENLVDILHNRQAIGRKRSHNRCFSDELNEEKSDIANAYNSLGNALVRNGKLNEAASKLELSLKLCRMIHGHDKVHPAIAASLGNLGNVYRGLGKLGKALEKHEQSLEMYLAIIGDDKPHPAIAASLNNLGLVYEELGKPDKAFEKHEQSLEMYLAIHGHDKPHPCIAASLGNLGLAYEGLGKLEKALEKHKDRLEMELAIHGHDKPHPSIAASLSNLGNVYGRLGKFVEALERHEQSLEMKFAIHGLNKPHPDTAISFWNIGFVYHKQKNLDKAVEFLERSFEMLRIVHAKNLLHPHIMEVLCDLADV